MSSTRAQQNEIHSENIIENLEIAIQLLKEDEKVIIRDNFKLDPELLCNLIQKIVFEDSFDCKSRIIDICTQDLKSKMIFSPSARTMFNITPHKMLIELFSLTLEHLQLQQRMRELKKIVEQIEKRQREEDEARKREWERICKEKEEQEREERRLHEEREMHEREQCRLREEREEGVLNLPTNAIPDLQSSVFDVPEFQLKDDTQDISCRLNFSRKKEEKNAVNGNSKYFLFFNAGEKYSVMKALLKKEVERTAMCEFENTSAVKEAKELELAHEQFERERARQSSPRNLAVFERDHAMSKSIENPPKKEKGTQSGDMSIEVGWEEIHNTELNLTPKSRCM